MAKRAKKPPNKKVGRKGLAARRKRFQEGPLQIGLNMDQNVGGGQCEPITLVIGGGGGVSGGAGGGGRRSSVAIFTEGRKKGKEPALTILYDDKGKMLVEQPKEKVGAGSASSVRISEGASSRDVSKEGGGGSRSSTVDALRQMHQDLKRILEALSGRSVKPKIKTHSKRQVYLAPYRNAKPGKKKTGGPQYVRGKKQGKAKGKSKKSKKKAGKSKKKAKGGKAKKAGKKKGAAAGKKGAKKVTAPPTERVRTTQPNEKAGTAQGKTTRAGTVRKKTQQQKVRKPTALRRNRLSMNTSTHINTRTRIRGPGTAKTFKESLRTVREGLPGLTQVDSGASASKEVSPKSASNGSPEGEQQEKQQPKSKFLNQGVSKHDFKSIPHLRREKRGDSNIVNSKFINKPVSGVASAPPAGSSGPRVAAGVKSPPAPEPAQNKVAFRKLRPKLSMTVGPFAVKYKRNKETARPRTALTKRKQRTQKTRK